MKIFGRWHAVVVVIVLSAAMLMACGGGGSSSSSIQQTPATSSVSGVASKGLLSGATITAYPLNASGVKGTALGSAKTDANGAYSINVGSYTGAVILEASGGSYIDEATGLATSNTSILRAAVTNVSGNITAAVTPLTEIAVQKAGTPLTAANITSANTLVSNMIGGTDIITTIPANVLASSSSTTAAKNYGLMLAAVSQMSHTTSTSVSTVIAQIAADLADNTLNTTGATLASALSTFITSSSNATGLIATDAQGSIAVYASTAISTNPLYSMQDLAGTWYGAGIKTPTINTNSAFNFGYDVDRLDLSSNGSGILNTISTSDVAYLNEPLPAGFLTIKSDGTMIDAYSNSTFHSYWYMNAGKDVMYQFFNDADGEQQLFLNVKTAPSYTISDLDGTWYSAGIKTPIKNTNNPANFGYDVEQMVISNGSATVTTLLTSDVSGTGTFTIAITSSGTISVGDPNNYWFMNASKDVMYSFWFDTGSGEQQLFISVKKAASYSASDLVGTWYMAGIRTPIKDTSNPSNFGYDINQLIINADGSGTVTPVATSDPRPADSFPAGTVTITSDGTISADPDSAFFMNAGKNVLYQLYVNPGTGEQQLFVYLKKAQ